MGNRPSHFHPLKKAIEILVAIGHLQAVRLLNSIGLSNIFGIIIANFLAEIDTGFGKRYLFAPNQSSKDPETFLEAA